HAAHLLERAALDVLELRSDALGGLGLLALDLLCKLPLPPAQALGDLVKRPAALGGVALEVGGDLPGDLVDRPVELLADLGYPCAVLFERALEPLRHGVDLRLDRGDQLLLAGARPLQLRPPALVDGGRPPAPGGP